jgi:hypothetical protein
MSILKDIEHAFAGRAQPLAVVKPNHPATDEYTDALTFQGKTWRSVTCKDLENHGDAVFGFSPAAFCYFLPAVYSIGIRESRSDLLVNGALVQMLDRANIPSSWDEFFIDRWATLSIKECSATHQWLMWLADREPDMDAALSRAFDTIDLISKRHVATPLASRFRPPSG